MSRWGQRKEYAGSEEKVGRVRGSSRIETQLLILHTGN